jgi:hypothetical protein
VNPFTLALAAAALGVYLRAFAWLGIACSVTARSARVAIARALPAALFAGGGFWLVPGCCGMMCVVGASGSGGLGELLAHGAAFLLGFTPAVVLAGLPAIEFSYLQDVRGRDLSYLGSLACGGVVGTGTWILIGTELRDHALKLFAQTTGRPAGVRLPFSWPTRPPPPEGPTGSS